MKVSLLTLTLSVLKARLVSGLVHIHDEEGVPINNHSLVLRLPETPTSVLIQTHSLNVVY